MIRFLFLLTLFCPVFFLFTYNSGYGYDAYEYLIIGRTLSKGYDLYDFILTKSYLLYASTNALLSLLGGYNHISISLLITGLAAGTVTASWLATRVLGARTALLSAGLTAVSCFFMEMNFLEPESWVAIWGLSAFGIVIRQDSRPFWRWLLAGALLGIGMCFKSIAAFYMVGFGAYILMLTLTGRQTIGQMLTRGSLVLAGFAGPLFLSAAYFWLTGRLAEHLEWTYIYPFGGYPSHTLFLTKFFVKLGWFMALLLASVALLAVPKFRAGFGQSPGPVAGGIAGRVLMRVAVQVAGQSLLFPGGCFLRPIHGVYAGSVADGATTADRASEPKATPRRQFRPCITGRERGAVPPRCRQPIG